MCGYRTKNGFGLIFSLQLGLSFIGKCLEFKNDWLMFVCIFIIFAPYFPSGISHMLSVYGMSTDYAVSFQHLLSPRLVKTWAPNEDLVIVLIIPCFSCRPYYFDARFSRLRRKYYAYGHINIAEPAKLVRMSA